MIPLAKRSRLAVYRSGTEGDELGCRRDEQRPQESIIDIRQPFLAPIFVLVRVHRVRRAHRFSPSSSHWHAARKQNAKTDAPAKKTRTSTSCFRIGRICSTGQHERGHLKRAHEARGVLYCAYEAHGAGKTVLRGSQTTEAKLPAVGACARSRHAGIYACRTQWHFSRSRDVTVSLCKLVDSWSRRSGRISGLPMSQCGLVAVPILHMKRTPTLS